MNKNNKLNIEYTAYFLQFYVFRVLFKYWSLISMSHLISVCFIFKHLMHSESDEVCYQ